MTLKIHGEYYTTTNSAKSGQNRSSRIGLTRTFWPLLRLMKAMGMWTFQGEPMVMMHLAHICYAMVTAVLITGQFLFVFAYNIFDTTNNQEMAFATVTSLFFLHGITKYFYLAMNAKDFFKLLMAWNRFNSHPLFEESSSRHMSNAFQRSRKLMMTVGLATLCSGMLWIFGALIDSSTIKLINPFNKIPSKPMPRLMVSSHYFHDFRQGLPYYFTFLFQIYFVMINLIHASLFDLTFCCFLIYAVENLAHLKEILNPMVELSASLDTDRPHVKELFRNSSFQEQPKSFDEFDTSEVYSSKQIYATNPLHIKEMDDNYSLGQGRLTKKQELLVRSAIKYWVERHKHVHKYVQDISALYGGSLLLHMLTSTITLTLLAYQATKVDYFDLFAACTVGYLVYCLVQVFAFCVYGNMLIEQSAALMESAYKCNWYDGSEEAKTFVQIICQYCQKPLMITGAKFFNVSLDLFASVLGAFVTYYMVLIQLK